VTNQKWIWSSELHQLWQKNLGSYPLGPATVVNSTQHFSENEWRRQKKKGFRSLQFLRKLRVEDVWLGSWKREKENYDKIEIKKDEEEGGEGLICVGNRTGMKRITCVFGFAYAMKTLNTDIGTASYAATCHELSISTLGNTSSSNLVYRFGISQNTLLLVFLFSSSTLSIF